jgi:cytochrome c peroxidase
MRFSLKEKWFGLSVIVLMISVLACQDDDVKTQYDPTPYPLSFGAFPDPNLPADNLPTIEGVQLGRMLFYEKRLSDDNTISCAGCHKQQDGFSDIRRFSMMLRSIAEQVFTTIDKRNNKIKQHKSTSTTKSQ